MTKVEIEYMMPKIDAQITEVVTWIKHYYGTITIEPQQAVDIKSVELGKQLDRYYYLRVQKEGMIKDYNEH